MPPHKSGTCSHFEKWAEGCSPYFSVRRAETESREGCQKSLEAQKGFQGHQEERWKYRWFKVGYARSAQKKTTQQRFIHLPFWILKKRRPLKTSPKILLKQEKKVANVLQFAQPPRGPCCHKMPGWLQLAHREGSAISRPAAMPGNQTKGVWYIRAWAVTERLGPGWGDDGQPKAMKKGRRTSKAAGRG